MISNFSHIIPNRIVLSGCWPTRWCNSGKENLHSFCGVGIYRIIYLRVRLERIRACPTFCFHPFAEIQSLTTPESLTYNRELVANSLNTPNKIAVCHESVVNSGNKFLQNQFEKQYYPESFQVLSRYMHVLKCKNYLQVSVRYPHTQLRISIGSL